MVVKNEKMSSTVLLVASCTVAYDEQGRPLLSCPMHEKPLVIMSGTVGATGANSVNEKLRNAAVEAILTSP